MTARAQAFDAIIIGAGAAGMMCAITAGQRGKRVLLLDRAERAGAKILISGGGRCNFTNLEVTPERFLSANPHFCKSALSRHTQHDFIAMVERHRIAYHEKTLGQLFCDGSAREIVAMLLAECACAGVEIRLGCRVTEVVRAGQFISRPTSARSRRRSWCSPAAVCRFRKWVRPALPTISRAASASRSSSRARVWCRCAWKARR